MTPSEVICKLLAEAKLSQRDLATAMGYASQGTVSNRLKRDNMTMNTFDEMLRVLNYEIVIRSKEDPQTEFVVTAEKEAE